MMARTKLANTLVGLIIFGGIFLVLYTTLFPFDFILRGDSFLKETGARFDFTWVKLRTPIDLLRNIVLFIPIGFGFTYILRKKLKTWIAVLTIGLGLSLTVELLQVLLPARDPSLSDLVTNSLGTFLGYLAFCWWGYKVLNSVSALIEKSKWLVSIKPLMTIFVGYLLFFVIISIYLQSTSNLSNWDTGFPLILGNERTGDRPWQGYISDLNITNRSLSEKEVTRIFSENMLGAATPDSVLVSYRLHEGTETFQDQSGKTPDLSWRGATSPVQSEKGVLLAPEQWLETVAPVNFITKKIRETSQFTLSAVVASASTRQEGPARIISISADPFHRNLTIGQVETDLNIRLRTPFTGENGNELELEVPDVFANAAPHQVVIAYDGSILRVYVDELQHSYLFKLTPEVMFFGYLLPVSEWSIHLNDTVMLFYKLLYYNLIFGPLGLLLGLMITLKRDMTFQILISCGGVLLPALLLEGSLSSMRGSSIDIENILLSIAIIMGAATILWFKLQTAPWLSSGTVIQDRI